MTNQERRDSQILYITDSSIMEEQKRARRLTQKLNTMDRSDFEGIRAVISELFGKSDGAWVNPPFYCDYGSNIEVGKNAFINYNCTIIDVGKVVIGENCQIAPNVSIYTAGHPVHPATRNTAYEYGIDITIGNNVWIGGNTVIMPGVHIGDNCQIAPNVSIYTAGHPVHPATRNTAYEYGIDITIGNNVWIGGNTVIMPGVRIGDNVVIGAGSIVTKDIPAWTVAAGNPCRVIRKITEADRYTYYKGVPADEECIAHMRRIWEESDDPAKYPTAEE